MVLMFVVIIIIVGAVSFYVGKSMSSNKQSAGNQNTPNAFGNNFAGRGGSMRAGAGNNFTGGTIISKDNTSITVQARDGSSKIVFFTTNTPILKMVAGKAEDIVTGKDITITGTPNPDGSISAESIQIRQAVTNSVQK